MAPKKKTSLPLINTPNPGSRFASVSPRPLRDGRTQSTINIDDDFFNRSIKRQNGSTRRLTQEELVQASHTPLIARAINLISDGVAAMPWTIKHPKNEINEQSEAIAEQIKKSIARPNRDFENQNTYAKFLRAIIRDLLVFNACAIERKPGFDKNFQSFWMWARPIEHIYRDPRWSAAESGLYPRYWYCPPGWHYTDWVPLKDEDLFIIGHQSSTRDLVSLSPVELAYQDLHIWLALRRFQSETVSEAVRDFMILLKDAGEEGVKAFEEKWENDVVGKGKVLIAEAELEIVKFGPKNDQELYPGEAEYLAQLIAMMFGLLKRDFGYYADANYATADIADQTSFQQAIRPVADTVIEHLDLEGVKYYHEGFGIELADRNPQRERDEADRVSGLYRDGIYSQNEARAGIGAAPVPDGDKFKNNTTIQRQEETDSADDEPIPPEPVRKRKGRSKAPRRPR